MPRKAKKKDTNTIENPYKSREFDTYVLWKSLPAVIKGQEPRFYEQLRITDEVVLELLEIKKQTEFAEKFGIKDLGTLTDWNKKIEEENLLQDKRKQWAKRLTGNMLMALYKKALIEGDASRIKLWYQLVEEWEERQAVKHSGSIESTQRVPTEAEQKAAQAYYDTLEKELKKQK